MAAIVTKVYGPPGTGKTTYMLKCIVEQLSSTVASNIGAASLTNAAVNVIKERMRKEPSIREADLDGVRTIHSHCFRLLKVRKSGVMEKKWISKFNADCQFYSLTNGKNNEIFRKINSNRNRMIPREEWSRPCRKMFEVWEAFMGTHDLIDYTGMAERCLEAGLYPDVKYLFVDEAQDLSRLQFELVDMWKESCRKVMMLGDVNQAIFTFAGADPRYLIDMKADHVVGLDQSYRLAPANLEETVRVISRARVKELVEFKPATGFGEGRVCKCISPDLSLSGTHGILTRYAGQLNPYIDELIRNRVWFHNPYREETSEWNPLSASGVDSIKACFNLRFNREISMREMKVMARHCIEKTCLRPVGEDEAKMNPKAWILRQPDTNPNTYSLHDLYESWGFMEEFLDATGNYRKFFKVGSGLFRDMIFEAAESNPLSLFLEPKVVVGTAHSVKGMTVDHVWVDLGVYNREVNGMRSSTETMDSEIRVVYVAISRARRTIGYLRGKAPQTFKYNPAIGGY